MSGKMAESMVAMSETVSDKALGAAGRLADAVDRLQFDAPTTHVYNPLRYAWAGHEAYLRRFASGTKRVMFLGMNPGPYGMAQTGVPFGEIALVRDWMGIEVPVAPPANEHPKRPIEGFACARSEVSGRRLWGCFEARFGPAETFFADHFVANYCPLVFMEASGRNRTPDKLPVAEVEPLYAACDAHLRELAEALQPEWVIGVGAFAEARAQTALAGLGVRTGRILHPSPASPAANRGWAEQATRQLEALGVW
jgi:single-strand selective monofunctional uracil DNA glycosylase